VRSSCVVSHLEPVLIKVPDHPGVRVLALVRVVERRAAASHRPLLVRPLRAPREALLALVPVKPFREYTHDAPLDKVPFLECNAGEGSVEVPGLGRGEVGLLANNVGTEHLLRGHARVLTRVTAVVGTMACKWECGVCYRGYGRKVCGW